MTKKDYELIAKVIRDAQFALGNDYLRGAEDQRISLAGRMTDALAQQNPHFKRVQFLQACGIITFPVS